VTIFAFRRVQFIVLNGEIAKCFLSDYSEVVGAVPGMQAWHVQSADVESLV